MNNFFSLLKRQITPVYLGIDIGTTSIKIAEVERGERPRLLNYAFLESQNSLARGNTALQTSTLKLFEEQVVELLRRALQKMQPRTKIAFASIPGFSAFMTVLKLPAMSREELERSIGFQARQYIPLPISEVALDWMKVGTYTDADGTEYEQVLLISVPQEQIKKYRRICESVGLELGVIEIEPLSLIRSVIGIDPTPSCIVDIGSRSTAIVIADGGELKFATQSDFAGASLTQAVASSLNIHPIRAEELKRERGVIGTGPNYELSTIMLPFVDVILQEVERAFASYAGQFPQAKKIERVLLSGGGANLLGLPPYAARELKVPVVKANPFSRFDYPSALEPFAHELNPLLAVALGLTLREPE